MDGPLRAVEVRKEQRLAVAWADDRSSRPVHIVAHRYELVAESRVAFQALLVHAVEHGDAGVHIVVHDHLALALALSVEPAQILCDDPFPGDRGREDERVESGLVETLAKIASSRDDDKADIICSLGDLADLLSPFSRGHSAAQQEDLKALLQDEPGKQGRMLPSPCDDKGSATSPQCQDGVLRDEPVARGMGAELVEHLVEAASRLDASQANVGEPRLKKAGEALLLSLLPWVYPVYDGAALHIEYAFQTIGAPGGGAEAIDPGCRGGREDLCQLRRRAVLTLVADDHAVAAYEPLDPAPAAQLAPLEEGLIGGDVHDPSRDAPPTPDPPDQRASHSACAPGFGQQLRQFFVDGEEGGQALLPLVE